MSRSSSAAFLNVSTAATGYKMEDYLWDKEITINGEKRFVGYYDEVGPADISERAVIDGSTIYTVDNPSLATLAYAEANGLQVDSTSAQDQTLGYIWRPTVTVKTGASYRFDDNHNLFANIGFFNRAPRYNNVIIRQYIDRFELFDENNPPQQIGLIEEKGRIVESASTNNEVVYAFELGYGFKSSLFSANVNSYYTYWDNKPLDRLPTVLEDPSDPESPRIPVNISGIAALHRGIEIDFALKIQRKITIEGLASLGDWKWNSGATTTLPNGATYQFDAKGVRVGDAAQTQLGAMIRVEPIRGLYFKLRGTHFGRNYSNFQPETLQGDDSGRQSWRLPDYQLLDLHTGYRFKVKDFGCAIRFNVLNILDTQYISDARNNDTFVASNNNGFNAQSASVHFGQGRRWSTALTISF